MSVHSKDARLRKQTNKQTKNTIYHHHTSDPHNVCTQAMNSETTSEAIQKLYMKSCYILLHSHFQISFQLLLGSRRSFMILSFF